MTEESVELEELVGEDAATFGRLPSIGLLPSIASSLMNAGLHEDQWKIKVRASPFLKTPILTSTVDLLGLETILYGPSNFGDNDSGLSTLT